jgi:hypothetical protein
MSGLKPSNVLRSQETGKNPLIHSSADGPWLTNALGREYKISKFEARGQKYYKQANGSAGWDIPRGSLITNNPSPAAAAARRGTRRSARRGTRRSARRGTRRGTRRSTRRSSYRK